MKLFHFKGIFIHPFYLQRKTFSVKQNEIVKELREKTLFNNLTREEMFVALKETRVVCVNQFILKNAGSRFFVKR